MAENFSLKNFSPVRVLMDFQQNTFGGKSFMKPTNNLHKLDQNFTYLADFKKYLNINY